MPLPPIDPIDMADDSSEPVKTTLPPIDSADLVPPTSTKPAIPIDPADIIGEPAIDPQPFKQVVAETSKMDKAPSTADSVVKRSEAVPTKSPIVLPTDPEVVAAIERARASRNAEAETVSRALMGLPPAQESTEDARRRKLLTLEEARKRGDTNAARSVLNDLMKTDPETYSQIIKAGQQDKFMSMAAGSAMIAPAAGVMAPSVGALAAARGSILIPVAGTAGHNVAPMIDSIAEIPYSKDLPAPDFVAFEGMPGIDSEDLWNTTRKAWLGYRSGSALKLAVATQNPQDVATYMALRDKRDSVPATRYEDAAKKAAETGSIAPIAAEFAPGNLLNTLVALNLQSTAMFVPSMIEHAPDAISRAGLGPMNANAVLTFMSSRAMEGAGMMEQVLQSEMATRKLDPKDPEQVLAVIAEPQTRERMHQQADAKGIPIAVVDAALNYMMPFAQVAQTARKATRVAHVAKLAAAEAVGSGLGEAAGELAAGEQLSPSDIIAEIAGSGIQTAYDITSAGVTNPRGARLKDLEDARATTDPEERAKKLESLGYKDSARRVRFYADAEKSATEKAAKAEQEIIDSGTPAEIAAMFGDAIRAYGTAKDKPSAEKAQELRQKAETAYRTWREQETQKAQTPAATPPPVPGQADAPTTPPASAQPEAVSTTPPPKTPASEPMDQNAQTQAPASETAKTEQVGPVPGERKTPVEAKTQDDIRTAEKVIDQNATPAQKEAENYRQAHVRAQGYDLTLETAKGSTRTAADGSWSVPDFPASYGKIKGSRGRDWTADKPQQLDAYLGDNPASDKIFVIDQKDPKTGEFDEHKVMLGFDTREEAVAVYNRAFSDGSGPSRMQAITETTKDNLDEFIASGRDSVAVRNTDYATYETGLNTPPQTASPTMPSGSVVIPRSKESGAGSSPIDVSGWTIGKTVEMDNLKGHEGVWLTSPDGKSNVFTIDRDPVERRRDWDWENKSSPPKHTEAIPTEPRKAVIPDEVPEEGRPRAQGPVQPRLDEEVVPVPREKREVRGQTEAVKTEVEQPPPAPAEQQDGGAVNGPITITEAEWTPEMDALAAAGKNPSPEATSIPSVSRPEKDRLMARSPIIINGHKGEGIETSAELAGIYAAGARHSDVVADMFAGSAIVDMFLATQGLLKGKTHIMSEWESLRAIAWRQIAGDNWKQVRDEAAVLAGQVIDMLKAIRAMANQKKNEEALTNTWRRYIIDMGNLSNDQIDQHAWFEIAKSADERLSEYREVATKEFTKKNKRKPNNKERFEILVRSMFVQTIRHWSQMKIADRLAPGEYIDEHLAKLRLFKRQFDGISKTAELLSSNTAKSERTSALTPEESSALKKSLKTLISTLTKLSPVKLKDDTTTAAFGIVVQWASDSLLAATTEPEKSGILGPATTYVNITENTKPDKMLKAIELAHESLAGADVYQGDSWQKLVDLSRQHKSLFLVVDPSYFAKAKADNTRDVNNRKNYGIATDIKRPEDLLYYIDTYLMPAWKNGARMSLTNTFDKWLVGELRKRGFNVAEFRRANNEPEFVAYNFNPETGTVLPQNPAYNQAAKLSPLRATGITETPNFKKFFGKSVVTRLSPARKNPSFKSIASQYTREQMVNAIVERYGTTDDVSKAMFALEDGRMIPGRTRYDADHRGAVSELGLFDKYPGIELDLFMEVSGAMRITHEGAELRAAPTDNQVSIILKLFNHYGTLFLDYAKVDKGQIDSDGVGYYMVGTKGVGFSRGYGDTDSPRKLMGDIINKIGVRTDETPEEPAPKLTREAAVKYSKEREATKQGAPDEEDLIAMLKAGDPNTPYAALHYWMSIGFVEIAENSFPKITAAFEQAVAGMPKRMISKPIHRLQGYQSEADRTRATKDYKPGKTIRIGKPVNAFTNNEAYSTDMAKTYGGPYLVRFEINEPTEAASLSYLFPGMGSDPASEVLFPRGTTFTVISTRMKDGVLVVEIEKNDKPIRAPAARFSPQRRPSDVDSMGMYSQLRRVLEQKLPARISIAQVRGIIDPQKGSGVKQDEIEWSGLKEFLDARQPTDMVTKAEVLDAAQDVELKELTKGGNGSANHAWASYTEDDIRTKATEQGTWKLWVGEEYIGLYPSEEAARAAARNAIESAQETQPTIFDEYQLPGGEDYREYLITMPPRGKNWYDQLTMAQHSRRLTTAEKQEISDFEERVGSSFSYGGHWEGDGEQATIFHFRTNRRKLADGRTALHVEEIQSDPAQKARELRDNEVMRIATEIAKGRIQPKLRKEYRYAIINRRQKSLYGGYETREQAERVMADPRQLAPGNARGAEILDFESEEGRQHWNGGVYDESDWLSLGPDYFEEMKADPTDADISEANKRVPKEFGFRKKWTEQEISKFTVDHIGDTYVVVIKKGRPLQREAAIDIVASGTPIIVQPFEDSPSIARSIDEVRRYEGQQVKYYRGELWGPSEFAPYNSIEQATDDYQATTGRTPSEAGMLVMSYGPPRSGNWTVRDGDGNILATPPRYVNKTAEEALSVVQQLARKGRLQGADKVNPMPFSDSSKGWARLAMKRIVRLAAEQGADVVTWTTGLQQVDRYETAIRQRVDKIEWIGPEGVKGRGVPGQGHVRIIVSKNNLTPHRYDVPLSGRTIIHGENTNLEGLIGKDMAGKIREAVARGETNGQFTGDDIAIGAGGMQGFYDEILVNIANDLGKKFGARAEMVDLGNSAKKKNTIVAPNAADAYDAAQRLPEGPTRSAALRIADLMESNATFGEALRIADTEYGRRIGDDVYEAIRHPTANADRQSVMVHGLAITPPMRESVLAGQPRFSPPRKHRQVKPQHNAFADYLDEIGPIYIPYKISREKATKGQIVIDEKVEKHKFFNSEYISIMDFMMKMLADIKNEESPTIEKFMRETLNAWITNDPKKVMSTKPMIDEIRDGYISFIDPYRDRVAGDVDEYDFMTEFERAWKARTNSDTGREEELYEKSELMMAVTEMRPGLGKYLRKDKDAQQIGRSKENPYRYKDSLIFKDEKGVWNVQLPGRNWLPLPAGRDAYNRLARFYEALEEAIYTDPEPQEQENEYVPIQPSEGQFADDINYSPGRAGAVAELEPDTEDATPVPGDWTAPESSAEIQAADAIAAGRPSTQEAIKSVDRMKKALIAENGANDQINSAMPSIPMLNSDAWTPAYLIAGLAGHRVVPVRWKLPANGMMLNGEMYVSDRTDMPVLATVGHELWHLWEARYGNTERGQAIIKALDELAPQDRVDAYRKALGKTHALPRGASAEARTKMLRDELYADLLGESVAKREFWERLADISRDAFVSLYRMIGRMVERILGVEPAYSTDQYFADVVKARDLAAEVYAMLVQDGTIGRTADTARMSPARQTSSVTPEQDAEYMAAVERGDMETAQRMVDEAAKNSGAINDGRHLYHGGDGNKTSFESGSSRTGLGLVYLTDSKRVAWKYALGGGIDNTKSLADYRRAQMEILPSRNPTVQNLVIIGSVADFSSFEDRPKSKYLIDIFGSETIENKLREFSSSARESLDDGNDLEAVLSAALDDGGWVQEDTDATKNVPELQVLQGMGILEEYLKAVGKNVIAYDDAESGGKTYVVMDSKQIKSADPITRDDQGNIIPLSKRFDSDSNDIRYSPERRSKKTVTEDNYLDMVKEAYNAPPPGWRTHRLSTRELNDATIEEWYKDALGYPHHYEQIPSFIQTTMQAAKDVIRGYESIPELAADILDDEQWVGPEKAIERMAIGLIVHNTYREAAFEARMEGRTEDERFIVAQALKMNEFLNAANLAAGRAINLNKANRNTYSHPADIEAWYDRVVRKIAATMTTEAEQGALDEALKVGQQAADDRDAQITSIVAELDALQKAYKDQEQKYASLLMRRSLEASSFIQRRRSRAGWQDGEIAQAIIQDGKDAREKAISGLIASLDAIGAETAAKMSPARTKIDLPTTLPGSVWENLVMAVYNGLALGEIDTSGEVPGSDIAYLKKLIGEDRFETLVAPHSFEIITEAKLRYSEKILREEAKRGKKPRKGDKPMISTTSFEETELGQQMAKNAALRNMVGPLQQHLRDDAANPLTQEEQQSAVAKFASDMEEAEISIEGMLKEKGVITGAYFGPLFEAAGSISDKEIAERYDRIMRRNEEAYRARKAAETGTPAESVELPTDETGEISLAAMLPPELVDKMAGLPLFKNIKQNKEWTQAEIDAMWQKTAGQVLKPATLEELRATMTEEEYKRFIAQKLGELFAENVDSTGSAPAPSTDILGTNITKLLAPAIMRRLIRQQISDMQTTAQNILGAHYSAKNRLKANLIAKLREGMNLSPYQAIVLANEVDSRMNSFYARERLKAQKRFKKIFDDTETGGRNKQALNDLLKLINSGVFEQRDLVAAWARAVGATKMTDADIDTMLGYAPKIKNAQFDFEASEQINELFQFVHSKTPRQAGEFLRWFIYTNLLSGYKDDIRNLVYSGISTMDMMVTLAGRNPRLLASAMIAAITGNSLHGGLTEAAAAMSGKPVAKHIGKLDISRDFTTEIPGVKQYAKLATLISLRPLGAMDMLITKQARDVLVHVIATEHMKAEGTPERAAIRKARELVYGTRALRKQWMAEARRAYPTTGLKGKAKADQILRQHRAYEEKRMSRIDADLLDKSLEWVSVGMNNNTPEGLLGEGYRAVMSFTQSISGKYGPVTSYQAQAHSLFLRIATNIINSNLSMFPIWVFGRRPKSFRKDTPAHQKSFYRQREIKGMLLMALMYALDWWAETPDDDDDEEKKKDRKINPPFAIYGFGPNDPALRAAWMQSGGRPFSIKLPIDIPGVGKKGDLLDYRQMAPFSFVLAGAGVLADVRRGWIKVKDPTIVDQVTYVTTGILRAIAGSTWLTTYSKTFDLVGGHTAENIADVAGQAIGNAVNSLTPLSVAAKQINEIFNKVVYQGEVAADGEPTSGLAKFAAYSLRNMPFADHWLKPRINALGDTVTKEKVGIFVNEWEPDPVYNWLMREDLTHVVMRGPSISTKIGESKDGFNDPNTGKLAPDDYYDLTMYSGQAIKAAITAELSKAKPAWGSTPEQKEKWLEDTRRTAIESAKKKLLGSE